jgi:hypothetical protein
LSSTEEYEAQADYYIDNGWANDAGIPKVEFGGSLPESRVSLPGTSTKPSSKIRANCTLLSNQLDDMPGRGSLALT